MTASGATDGTGAEPPPGGVKGRDGGWTAPIGGVDGGRVGAGAVTTLSGGETEGAVFEGPVVVAGRGAGMMVGAAGGVVGGAITGAGAGIR